jgi:hypothetical protein
MSQRSPFAGAAAFLVFEQSDFMTAIILPYFCLGFVITAITPEN